MTSTKNKIMLRIQASAEKTIDSPVDPKFELSFFSPQNVRRQKQDFFKKFNETEFYNSKDNSALEAVNGGAQSLSRSFHIPKSNSPLSSPSNNPALSKSYENIHNQMFGPMSPTAKFGLKKGLSIDTSSTYPPCPEMTPTTLERNKEFTSALLDDKGPPDYLDPQCEDFILGFDDTLMAFEFVLFLFFI